MRRVALMTFALVCSASGAWASCPGNPNALGTSRAITLKPEEFPRVGTQQYSQMPQLPLADHEVVLSFDDGPMPPYTEAILKTLASECVKATFFMVGRQANEFPETARRVHAGGHTIGSHSQNHPLTFDQMPVERARAEIDDGIASISNALGDPRAVAPFFRIPGLLRVAPVEDYLASRSIAIWSVDVVADDWYRSVTPHDIVRKAMTRLDAKGRGILLLHDVHPATALALPALLRELKVRGYRVVQVVPYVEKPKPVATSRRESPRELASSRRKKRTVDDGWHYYRR